MPAVAALSSRRGPPDAIPFTLAQLCQFEVLPRPKVPREPRAAARAELAARGGAEDLRAHERKVPKGGDGEEGEAHRRHLIPRDVRKEQQQTQQQMRTWTCMCDAED